MTKPTLSTVREALAWARGSPDARDLDAREADRLLARVLGLRVHDLHLDPGRPLTRAEGNRFRDLCRERASGVPLQHLLGEVEFRSLVFAVRPGVFVPRPETEVLADLALAEARAGVWLDVGTGSGVLAVTLAVHVPGLRVVATDISREALRLAGENARRHGVADRVPRVRADLLAPFPATGWADGIVSNPPYVAEGEKARLPVEVRDHDPREALFSGPDGLSHERRIIAAAPGVLRPGGTLALEIGDTQADAVRDLLRDGPWSAVRVIPDLTGRARVAAARRT